VNLLDDSEKSNQTLKEKQSLLEHANSQMQEQQAQLEEVNSQMEEQQVQLRQSESELKLQNKKLEDSNRYKSEFLANMSHELRTPLNSVILLSSMLNENKKGNLNEDDVKKAKIINSSGNELLRLINDVLDLSKIEAGKMELMIDTFNSSQFIENIKDLFEASVLVKELKLIVEDRYNNYIVNDEDKLSQVLRNFISNSLKFTHEGFIKIIIDSYEDNKVKISVQDTGIGIPNEKLNSIFNAFEQVDGSTSRKYGGTGLGLSITKEIVSLMGGELSLESKENEGSTFSIIIPNKSESNSIKDIPKVETEKVNDDYIKPLDGVDLNDKKILVVDDDMRNIFTLVEILEDKGAEVITASNGKESIQRLEEHKDTNLVLMDIMMPVMDGFEAIEHIRDDETTKDIPIIAVTAKAMNQDKERCLSLGANDFLTKPLNLETFSRVVNAWIK
ncbi:MAG: ATP-binding protein, partial [Campylobacterota bacterium]|nr:ATP-binding protein [Campylobacterota bacterium]